MSAPLILSFHQAKTLLSARGKESVECTPDLGRSFAKFLLTELGAMLGDLHIPWDTLETIASQERKCFLYDGSLIDIRLHSRTTGWVRSLAPTAGAPTMLVSGFPMHRIKDMDPWQDTKFKIEAISPIRGRVLDTATGLGYTAIQAAATAEEVLTIELDPTGIEIAKWNPWSQPLFENPKIKQILGDSSELVAEFETGFFSAILHDPPSISLGGELYSREFYAELRRILSPKGKLFHYVGDPKSGLGARTTQGVMKRLHESGFKTVERHSKAFGVVAYGKY